MFKHFIKLAFRHLLKRKVFTLINLFGLSTGMAVCLLIGLYIHNELGYDNFHQQGDQVYRLAVERKYPGRTALKGLIPQSVGQAVKKEFPEVLESVRVLDLGGAVITIGTEGKTFEEKGILAADSNFFSVFTGQFLEGDGRTALLHPNSLVINERTAKRYFGSSANAMGKPVSFERGGNKYTVTAVCRDWPEKSHMRFNLLIPTSNFTSFNEPDYYDFSCHNYLLLNQEASPKALEAKLPLIVEKYVAGTIQKGFGESYHQFLAEGNGYRYFLQPLQKIHLYSNLEDEFHPGGSIDALHLVVAIASFILFLACINFINLSTALSVERAREVGIRKTFGSDKGAILWQFLGESVGFSLISLFVAILLAALALPLMDQLTGNDLSITYYLNPGGLLLITGIASLIGLAAGVYPALILSSFRPILVLKGRFKSSGRGRNLRDGLVIFQFSISVILIVCTFVVNSQMQYVLGDKLGFKKDHIIAIHQIWHLGDNRNAFLDELSRTPGVEVISKCSDLPDGAGFATCAMQAVASKVSRTEKTIYTDGKYLDLLGLQLTVGRSFSKDFGSDSLSLILNQQAVADFGLKDPIGSKITSTELHFNPVDGKMQNIYTVVGVVRDFHFESLHQKIAPLVIANTERFGWETAAIRIKGDHFRSAVDAFGKVWKQFEPKYTFQYTFLDQGLEAQYKAEQTTQRVFTVFSFLAIFIACIGLLGLATYTTFQRTKEISIRKILGASTGNIIFILSGGFLRLVVVSALIAFPVAWWFMHRWLQNFAYRVGISWKVFLVAGMITTCFALLTISFQAIKAAVSNPARSLRTE